MSLTSKEIKDWTSWIASSLFTFASKPVNSNALPVGVRPGLGRSHGLLHVSASMLLDCGERIGLDYVAGSTSDMSKIKKMRVLIGEISGKKKQLPVISEPDLKIAYEDQTVSPAEYGTHRVCPRMRQLMLPDGAGGYRVISPLASAGLSEAINERLKARAAIRQAHAEIKKQSPKTKIEGELRREMRVPSFLIGGSNAQNVGGRVHAFRRPLVLDNLPETSPSLRHAFSVIHKGLDLRLPRAVVIEYARWWSNRSASIRSKAKPYAQIDANKEQSFALEIVAALNIQAARALEVLSENERTLYAGSKIALEDALANDLSPEDMGWMFASRRDYKWKGLASRFVLDALLRTALARTEDGAPITMDLSPGDQQRLMGLIEENI